MVLIEWLTFSIIVVVYLGSLWGFGLYNWCWSISGPSNMDVMHNFNLFCHCGMPQSDRVKSQFRLSQEIPKEPNNLDHLHKLDMKGRQDENWITRNAQWIKIWNNRCNLTLNGLPMLGPLQHTITTKKILFSGGYFFNLWGFSPSAN